MGNEDLAFKSEIAVVNGYGDYMHNGFFWYASDGSSLFKFDENRQEMTVRKIRSAKSIYYSRAAVVNECILVGLGTGYSENRSFTVFDFILLNGAEIYSINLGIKYADLAAISVGTDGKIYVLNSENMSVSVIDFTRM